MSLKITNHAKKQLNWINILLGGIVAFSLFLSYLLTNEQTKLIPLFFSYLLFMLFTASIIIILLLTKYYDPHFLLYRPTYLIGYIIISVLFYTLLFFLFRFIKHLIANCAHIQIAILGISILLPFFTYWWTSTRIPTPFGWKMYFNTINVKYGFAYPKEWVLTECGNGSVVVSKNPIEKCLYPLDASENYIDNLYFQIFDASGPHLDIIAWKDATVSAHIKNMETVFWSRQEFYNRRMRGDYVPLYVDPKKVKVETYTIGSQTFKVTRYKGGFPQLGVNKYEYETNNQLQQVLDSFRF